MYSKMTNDKNEIELPPNYGGSVFGRRESAPRFIPPQGMTARRPTREYAPPAVLSEHHKAPEYEDLKSGEKPVQEVKYTRTSSTPNPLPPEGKASNTI